MHKDFTICPHCFAKGKDRRIRPATPHRTPLVSRSDGRSFHLFVEESQIRPAPQGRNFEIVALFRYDLDPDVKAESSLVLIPLATNDSQRAAELLAQAADKLAEILARAESLKRVYAANELGMPATY